MNLPDKVGLLAKEVQKIQDHPFYPRFGKQQKKAACREYSGILRGIIEGQHYTLDRENKVRACAFTIEDWKGVLGSLATLPEPVSEYTCWRCLRPDVPVGEQCSCE